MASEELTVRKSLGGSALLVVISGVALAVVGGIWWAFDAGPTIGKLLLAAGLAIAVLAFYFRGRLAGPGARWALLLGLVVLIVAAVELWAAIAHINENRAPRLAAPVSSSRL